MSYLLDTNVISEIRRPRPDPAVSAWLAAVPSRELHTSVLVVGEIRQGVERLRARDPLQAERIDAWLARLIDRFGDRIAPVSFRVADRWGRLNSQRRLPVVDGLLAATALTHDWVLVTRNARDLKGTGVDVLNPFSDA